MKSIKSTIRVAYFTHTPFLSGGELSLLSLLKNINRKKVNPILIVSHQGSLSQAVQKLGIPIYYLNLPTSFVQVNRNAWWGAWGWRFFQIQTALKQLRQICLDSEINILHTNSLKAHLMAALLKKKTPLKVVWHMRDILRPGMNRWILTRFSKKIDHVISISQKVQDQFGNSLDPRKHSIIANGLERLPKTKAVFKSQKTWTLICMGQIARWKGQDIFIDLIDRLVTEGYAVRGIILGKVLFPQNENRFERRLKNKIRQLGLQKKVQWAGHQKNIESWLRKSDLLIHPNRRPEPFGRVLVEAMLFKKPVITSIENVSPEILPRMYQAYLARHNRLEDYFQTVRLLIRSEKLYYKLAEIGYQHAAKNFQAKSMVQKVLESYQKVLR